MPHPVRPPIRAVIRAARVAVVAIAVPVVASPSVASVDAAPVGSAACDAPFTVVDGDSWYALAAGAGIPPGDLLAANGADSSTVIRPGDRLCLPAGTSTPASWSERRCGSGAAYTVAGGDSWYGIASRAGVTSASLLEANGADASRLLHPGDTLCLPAGASLGATGSAASPPSGIARLDALPLHGPCWFGDTWQAPRPGGRRHQGADLIAQTGRYVYAVVDGTLTRRAWAQPGLRAGNAWWLTAADGSGTYYFYAHLSDFAPGLQVGSRVEAGEIIGFVGDTGASSTAHLHFEIHPAGGEAVDPHPVLQSHGGCKSGAGYRQPSGWTPSADEAEG